MTTYKLVSGDGETIAITKALCQDEAIEYFAAIKNLHWDELLEIFEVLINE